MASVHDRELSAAIVVTLQVEKEHRWLPRLAPLLPLPIPVPLAKGFPDNDYPWHWSIYQWIEGENATIDRIADLPQFAITLAQYVINEVLADHKRYVEVDRYAAITHHPTLWEVER